MSTLSDMCDVEFHQASNKAMELGEGVPVVQCALTLANPVMNIVLDTVGIGPRTFVAAVITEVETAPTGSKDPAFGTPYKYMLKGYRRKASSSEFEPCSWMANDVECIMDKVPVR